MYSLYGHLGKTARIRYLSDAFSDAAAAANAASAATATASGLGIVKNTFCLGPTLLKQFDVPTATRIIGKLLTMPWGRSAAVPSGASKQYSNWTVTYYKGVGVKPYAVPPGYYALLDSKFAAEGAWAPGDLKVPVTITNDLALIKILSGSNGSYANIYPLRPIPTTCPDGINPTQGLTPAAAASRGFSVNSETTARDSARQTTMDIKGPTSSGGGDSSGALVIGVIALAAVAAMAMSGGKSTRDANPVPEYAY
jgi:hypothetical protein